MPPGEAPDQTFGKPIAGFPFSSTLIGLAMDPSVRSVQSFAMITPSSLAYGWVNDIVNRVAGVPPFASHAAYIPLSPAASASSWQMQSAPSIHEATVEQLVDKFIASVLRSPV